MKRFHGMRVAGCAAAALLMTASLVQAQVGGGLTGAVRGATGGTTGAAGGAGAAASGGAAVGGRLNAASTVRGLNPAQAVRGTTGAGVNARANVGLGAAGTRASVSGQTDARARTGLLSGRKSTGVASGAEMRTDGALSIGAGATSRGNVTITGRERAQHQAQLTLNHRLAEIDRMRDQAVTTGNTTVLAQADKLEAQARAQYDLHLRSGANADVRSDAALDAEASTRGSASMIRQAGAEGEARFEGAVRSADGTSRRTRSGVESSAEATLDAEAEARAAGSARVRRMATEADGRLNQSSEIRQRTDLSGSVRANGDGRSLNGTAEGSAATRGSISPRRPAPPAQQPPATSTPMPE